VAFYRLFAVNQPTMKTILALTASALALLGGAAATAARADAPPQDENWLQTSISGDRFEIAGGTIALRRAETPAARTLARRLIHDHSKSLADAVKLARQLGVGVPPAATPSEQWQLNRLKNMPRSWFDVQYAALEIKDHNQDIEETGLEAREGELWQVRAEAKKDLPMLTMHLKMSKSTLTAAEAANSR
jgi:putative membrane protein